MSTHLRIICIGRKAKDPLLASAEEYLKRLGRYSKVDLVRIRDGDPQSERKRMEAKLDVSPGGGEYLVALDETGRQITTRDLADKISSWHHVGVGRVTFLIGGANGLHPDLLARAREKLGLSRLTLPHRMALSLLCEQLYRAHTILRGEPYHRG